MSFVAHLKTLLKQPKFRRLFKVRVCTQTADGTLQVAMASHILFSPENQTNAWAIAGVLAITLLPFSVIEPFVSIFLDRWSRSQIVVVLDTVRAFICICLAVLVASGNTSPGFQIAIFAIWLVANSINRFLLTGLNASLPHAIDEKGYLMANSVIPMIGPLGLLFGGAVAMVCRFALAKLLTPNYADAAALCVSLVLFLCSVTFAKQVARTAWGPSRLLDQTTSEPNPTGEQSILASVKDAVAELTDGLRHIKSKPHVMLAFTLTVITRVLFGMLSVAMILTTRHLFHSVSEANGALLDMAIWSGAMGVGYVVAPVLLSPISAKLKVRNTMIFFFVIAALIQVIPGCFLNLPAQVFVGLWIGICAQALRILIDTLLQSHCHNEFKGRVLIIYDIIYNASFALSGLFAALVVNPNGLTVGYQIGLAVAYLAGGLITLFVGLRLGSASFNRGTHFDDTQVLSATSS